MTEHESAAAVEIFTSALRQEGADGQVEWSLVRLDKTMLLDARMGDRHVAITATSLDDFPGVARRAARSLATGLPLEDTKTPDSVTGVESKAPHRTYTERSFGVTLMPVMPFAGGVGMEPGLATGIALRLDKTRYFYQIDAGALLPSFATDKPGIGGAYSDLGIGLNLSNDNTAWYAGGGVSARVLGGFDDVIVGIAPYGNVGVTLDRSSSSHFFIEARVAQNIIPLTEENWDVYDTTTYEPMKTKHYVTEPGVRVGLLF